MKTKLLFLIALITISVKAQTELLSSITETFDGTNYTNNYGADYEYDSNNNLISSTEYIWNSTNWVENRKYILNYNLDNRATEIIEQDFDGSNFINQSRSLYSYNGNGNATQEIGQNWNGSVWINSYKYDITYTGNQVDIGTFSYWDGAQWVLEYRTIYTFTGNNLTESLFQFWDGTQWVSDDGRLIFSYNGNNKLTSGMFQLFNGSNWVNDETINFEYDSNQNRIRETIISPVEQTKIEYNYDTSAILSNFAHPFLDKTGFDFDIGVGIQRVDFLFDDIPFVNKILSSTDFLLDSSTNTYTETDRTTYNYNSTLSIDSFEEENVIKLFPNPTADFIEIGNLKKEVNIFIYNALGVKLMSRNIGINEKINVQNFPNGLYFLVLESGNTFKFIKE